MSLSRFISLWAHPDYAADAVSEDDLKDLQNRLQTRLPADYCQAVLEFGLPRPTMKLLDAIVDRQLDVRDVSNFLGAAEIVTVTEGWRDLGLPDELVAFATDCMGNLFCFPAEDNEIEEAPVFFFDHDERSVEVVARSFTQWIEGFCRVAPN